MKNWNEPSHIGPSSSVQDMVSGYGEKKHHHDKCLNLLIIICLHLSYFTSSAKCHEINLEKVISQIIPVHIYSETNVCTEEKVEEIGQIRGWKIAGVRKK